MKNLGMWRKILRSAIIMGGVYAVALGNENGAYSASPSENRETVNRIVVEKAARRMTLFVDQRRVAEYRISLGGNPIGHKQQEGDRRTPEGIYTISGRNPKSAYHLSLRISYPSAEDTASAKARGVPAGGDIMIHGLPNNRPDFGAIHQKQDWTDGCIAVTDAEIEQIWAAVPNGAVIEIKP